MLRCAPVLVLTLLAAGPELARDPFGLDLTVDGQTGSRTLNRLEDAYNSLSTASLRSIAPNYTDSSEATAVLDLRGVRTTGRFEAASPVLPFAAPELGINETLTGSNREQSRQLFERWLQGRGRRRVDALLHYATRTTPIDPTAGDPSAPLTGLTASDLGRALEASLGDGTAFGIGARFGSFSAGGYDSRNSSLLLDYSWRVSERDTLQLDVSLAYADTSGGASSSGNVGLFYRRRVLALQASGHIGAAGWVDPGSGSGVHGLGLVSTSALAARVRLTVANGVNHVATFPVPIGRYSIDYGVSNNVFRNGMVLTRDLGVELWGWPLTGSASAVGTRFTGMAVHVRHFQEFGAFISVRRGTHGGLGITLLTGDRGPFGGTVNTGVRF